MIYFNSMIERLWPLLDTGIKSNEIHACLLLSNGLELTGQIQLMQGILIVISQDPAKGVITNYVEPSSVVMVRILSE